MKIFRCLFAGMVVPLLAISLAACTPSAEEIRKNKLETQKERAVLAQECRDAGGRYILTIPPGYTTASYWCIWDSEKEGGEW